MVIIPKPLPPEVTTFLGIDAVHVDTFGGKTTVRLCAFPEVIEGSPLNSVHQSIVRKSGSVAGVRILTSSEKEQEEKGKVGC